MKEEQIVEIREHSDIVDIIGRYIPLKKQGKNFAAVCPFHDDHNPSMSISPDKQIYKCFVCGAGGNAFTFVQNYEEISFVEAVAKVASMSNLDIQIDTSEQKPRYDQKTMHSFKIMEETIQLLNYQLQSVAGKEIKEYLTNRGITEKLIKDFSIGFDESELVTNFLLKKGYEIQDLVELNLAKVTDSGPRDVFSNRIVFPIHDSNGNPVGFTARAYPPDNTPKYINTQETSIYTKGNILYNYHRVRKEARNKGHLYLVEGVIDALALTQVGVSNVVASLGTALTKQQVHLLKVASPLIRICYDGDSAGQLASFKAGKLLLEAGCQIEIVMELHGLDPDEYRLKHGEEALRAVLESSKSWIEFLLFFYEQKYDLSNYSQKKEYAQAICKEIAVISDEFDRTNFIQLLVNKTGFEKSAILSLLPGKSSVKTNRIQQVSKPTLTRLSKVERAEYEIISQMLVSKEAALKFKEQLGFLFRQNANKVVLLILDFYRRYDELKLADFLSFIEDKELQQFIIQISDMELLRKEYDPLLLEEAILQINLTLIDKKIESVKSQTGSDPMGNAKLVEEIVNLKQEKEKLIEDYDLLRRKQ